MNKLKLVRNIDLTEAIRLSPGTAAAIVGAGGKTSAMFRAGKELSLKGRKILAATTTAIFHPKHTGSFFNRLSIGKQDIDPARGTVTVAAASVNGSKLKGFCPEHIDSIYKKGIFDNIIIEADGSKQLPVKAPAGSEPVIPLCCSMVWGVIGLDCLDKPAAGDYVHRPELFSKITGVPIGEFITEEALISLILSKQGLFKSACTPKIKKVLILNKADTPLLAARGISIAKRVIEKGAAEKAVITTLNREKEPVITLVQNI